MSIGIHLPTNLFDKPEEIARIPFDGYVQIMTGSPQSVNRESLASLVPFAKNPNINKKKSIIHAALCTNICRKQLNNYTIRYLRREIEIANMLDTHFICLHPGFLNKCPEEDAIANIAYVMRSLQPHLISSGVKILLEIMPDKTSMYMTSLEEYANIRNRLDDITQELVGYLIDTCHYHDNHSRGGISLKKLLQAINDNKLPLPDYIHLNNSSYQPRHLTPIYKNNPKDRHRCIINDGGTIAPKELKSIYQYFSEQDIPVVLETYHELEDFTNDIVYLKS